MIALLAILLVKIATAQADVTHTVHSKTILPLLQLALKGKTVKPFLDSIHLDRDKIKILLVDFTDKNLLTKISNPVLEDAANDESKSEGVINKNKATISFKVDNFDTIKDEDTLLFKLTIGKKVITFGKLFKQKKEGVAGIKKDPGGSNDKEKIDYIALAKRLHLSLNLADLYPKPGPCCEDGQNPCDIVVSIKINCDSNKGGKKHCDTIREIKSPYDKNKIVYYTNRNETVYYDNNGITKTIDYEDIKVRAGRPLSFEIRNVNPDAFKVEITDTAIAYEVRPDTLLSLLPGVSEDNFITEADVTTKRDIARAVLLIAYINLKEFFLNLQYSCIYEFNNNIERKIEARKRFDTFLKDNLSKNGNIGINQTLINELDTANSPEDKELCESILALYNNLPASYYRMITQIPSVPKDKDLIRFKFNILARENTPYMSLVKEKTIDAYIVKNFRIDVSSGLYYAFNMQNEKFVLRADSIVGRNVGNTADSTLKNGNKITKEDPGNGEFGFASFIHFYRRCTPWFSWGGLIGAGLSLNDKLKPRYFSGLSFLYGRDNTRIALNVGIVGGNVDQLSDQYPKELDGTLTWLPTSESGIVTKTKFVFQPFVSISYNLPFRSKKKSTEVVTTPKEDPKKDEGTTGDNPKGPKQDPKPETQSSKVKKDVSRKTYFK